MLIDNVKWRALDQSRDKLQLWSVTKPYFYLNRTKGNNMAYNMFDYSWTTYK